MESFPSISREENWVKIKLKCPTSIQDFPVVFVFHLPAPLMPLIDKSLFPLEPCVHL